MRTLLSTLIAVAALASIAGAAPLSPGERESYRKLADSIHGMIASLSDRYPQLSDYRHGGWRESAPDRFWLAYHYSKGVGWKPNPKRRPGVKGDARIKTFTPDGVSLDLYFFEGEWTGQAAVHPKTLGKIRLVMFLEGPSTPEFASLQKEIGKIVDESAIKAAKRQGP